MRLPRDIFADLVEKRLWPIAVLLVAALVAVPLVLAKSPAPQAGGDGVPSSPLAQSAASTPTPAVSVVTSGPASQAPLRGKAKNPFRQQHVAKQAAGGILPGGSPSPAAPTPQPSTGGGTPGGTPPPPTTPQKTYTRTAIDVRFGLAIDDSKRKITDVARLTPLPNAARPIVIFLGMRADHETAVFMVSSDVHAQGEGKCVPSRKTCESIELKEGETAFLDVTGANGRVKQYELVLDKVTVSETTSKADALASYARVSRRGERVLRISAKATAHATGIPLRIPFRYAAARGVLHIAPYASARHRHHRRASGAASHARAVADPHAPSLADIAP